MILALWASALARRKRLTKNALTVCCMKRPTSSKRRYRSQGQSLTLEIIPSRSSCLPSQRRQRRHHRDSSTLGLDQGDAEQVPQQLLLSRVDTRSSAVWWRRAHADGPLGRGHRGRIEQPIEVLAGKYGADVTIQNMVSPFLLPAALRCPCVVLLLLLLPSPTTCILCSITKGSRPVSRSAREIARGEGRAQARGGALP